MPQSELELANSAIAKVGAKEITVIDATTSEGKIILERLPSCRRALLRMHPWNFAIDTDRLTITKSVITGAANNGSGLIRITSVAHPFVTGDVVQVSSVQGTTEANGIWKITKISADTFDLQGSVFVHAYVSGGLVWPSHLFEWTYRYVLPSTCLRLLNVDQEDEWRIEGRSLICDSDTINVRFLKDITDYTLMDPLFYELLAHYLAHDICMKLAKNAELKIHLYELWKNDLWPKAKNVDAFEEPGRQIDDDQWLEDRRMSPRNNFIRDPMT